MEMSTEDEFQGRLNAEPDNHTVRLVFADWLEEQGDARADGYRALGRCRFCTGATLDFPCWWSHDGGKEARENVNPQAMLPRDWFDLLEGPATGGAYWRDYPNRRVAEDAAALAFAKLPAERRAELLRI
jgi:uncharacterized protein (TIGR02996 family)